MRVIEAQVIEDIEYRHGDRTYRLLADPDGIMAWLAPLADGKSYPPTENTYDEFLSVVIHPDDVDRLAFDRHTGVFGDKAAFDAAQEAWHNAMGIREFQTLATQLSQLAAQTDELLARIDDANTVADEEEE